MSGTKQGGAKTAKTIKSKYGPEFYESIGRLGGKANNGTGGFASKTKGRDGLTGSERASKVGTIGGKISKRGKAL